MWFGDEDPFKPGAGRFGGRFPRTDFQIYLPAPFSGDHGQSFQCWARQLEVAVGASAGAGGTCRDKLARILPTRLGGAAFLLWDSLPDFVKSDYEATKEKLGAAFGQRQGLERFRTSLSARTRAAGESLQVFAADVSRLVMAAFPQYGDVAQRKEKFRRFLAGLDPALKAKCLEQGATDLEEALIIAERCENAREALQKDCVAPCGRASCAGGELPVQSVSTAEGLHKAIDKLTEDMFQKRMEMKELSAENRRLRDVPRSLSPSVSRCACEERGCQARSVSERHRGRSPDREPYHPQWEYKAPRRQRYSSPSDSTWWRARSPSPGWGPSQDSAPRKRGVRFLPPRHRDDSEHREDVSKASWRPSSAKRGGTP
ncbi:uncharacterized protein LOC112141069 [Oryzias melastigma]|uniref:uncharacterized protein LOC112141069 n=1 Tax=Oryzias melastigma TaxID=30732 RepID=UPI000CF7F6FC|nr:uncharacterized protein LOC112141069 [Oryzias melastigma]